MSVKLITPPAELVTLAEARMQCRADNTVEDSLITNLISAARKYAEHYTQKAIGLQTLELALDEFPSGAIELPMSPATSITSIKYINTAGVETTMQAAAYVLDDYPPISWALCAYGTTWPATQAVANAVKVRYVAGLATVSAATRAAMLLQIAHLFENREAVNVGSVVTNLPMGVKALLDTDRTWSL